MTLVYSQPELEQARQEVARLRAQNAELLEALRDMVATYEDQGERPVLKVARAAIRRAKAIKELKEAGK